MFNFNIKKNDTDNMDCNNDEILDAYSLQFKNDEQLRSLAVKNNLINIFQPRLQKQDLIKLLVEKKVKREKNNHIKSAVWDNYIGKEIGQYPCLLCRVIHITQLTFQCGYGNPISRGGSEVLENLLPICSVCNSNLCCTNNPKTINEYLKSIGKTRMPFLSEKMKNIAEMCILNSETTKAHNDIKCTDEQFCRIIATNPMLWSQFIFLQEKLQIIKSPDVQKIKISVYEKMIVLSL